MSDVKDSIKKSTGSIESAILARLEEIRVNDVDRVVAQYYSEVSALQLGDTLSNDRIRHYLHQFGYYGYVLGTYRARESAKSTAAQREAKHQLDNALVNPKDESGRKLIREEKMAIASMAVIDFEREAIIYTGVAEAVEERIKMLVRLQNNLQSISMTNMSEAKLSAQGGSVS